MLNALKLVLNNPYAARVRALDLLGSFRGCALARLHGVPDRVVEDLRHQYRATPFFRVSREFLAEAPCASHFPNDSDLYVLTRILQPNTIVETGVGNGISSGAFLQGIADNRSGHLYSIDLPDYTLFDSRGNRIEIRPQGKPPGWLVPGNLKSNWTLCLGSSETLLPSILSDLHHIDLFMHDSDHSYRCMAFEFHAAWPHLVSGGMMVSDDIFWNRAFFDFCGEVRRKPYLINPARSALLRK